jgi:enolase
MKIVNLVGREVLDTNGWPTIACDVTLDDGTIISSVAPTNFPRGPHEAAELRDGGIRLLGLGVQKSIDIIRDKIFPIVMGCAPDGVHTDLKLIELDGTNNKANFGANTVLAVSQAIFRAQAVAENMQLFELIALVCDHAQVTLPIPMITLIENNSQVLNSQITGANSQTTTLNKNNTQAAALFREYLAIPYGAKSARIAIERSVMLAHKLKEILIKNYNLNLANTNSSNNTNLKFPEFNFGPEGGLQANFESLTAPLDYIMLALKQFSLADDPLFALGLDANASSFYDRSTNLYQLNGQSYPNDKLIELYAQICQNYPIYAIEDGMSISDAAGWQLLNVALGQQIHIASDELLATNPERIAYAAEQQMVGAVVLKPAQIGTVTEAIQAIKLCQEQNLMTIVAHYGSDTMDTFMVDLGVGTNATHLKMGGLHGGNQIAKYNRLLEIEDFLINLQL